MLLMADFAQILLVMSTSLMSGMSVIERGGSGARSMALAGRQVFDNFEGVVRLRRIYRQKGMMRSKTLLCDSGMLPSRQKITLFGKPMRLTT